MLKRALKDFREMATEQVDYKDLLYEITKRDLLLRYKQTVMGFGWAVCVPLLNTAIFSVVFTRIAPIDTGVPYPVFAYCGLWAWNFFASSLKFSANSLVTNTNLDTKVYFPRELFPLSAVLVSLVDFAVASIVLVGFMIWYRVPVGLSVLWVPVIVCIQMMFTMAIALMLSMSNLFYRDVKYLFEVVIMIWMFATSVVYPVEQIGGRLATVMRLNPMTPLIDAYRTTLLRHESPAIGPLGSVAVFSALLLLVSWFAFHRSEFEFAENV